jgi:predicted transcriptional regulator
LRGKKASTSQQHAKYRSEHDICAAILKVSERQVTKTRIMERAFLCSQNKEYIPILLENRLLTTNERQSLYNITEKGISFLELYDRLNEMLPSF